MGRGGEKRVGRFATLYTTFAKQMFQLDSKLIAETYDFSVLEMVQHDLT
jgi:hypothetical protein